MDKEIDTLPVVAPGLKLESIEQPGGVYQTYINHIVAAYTNHDILLRLGFLARQQEFSPSETPTLRLEKRAAIAMAWSEAKTLRDILADLIRKFEEINGEINIKPTIPS